MKKKDLEKRIERLERVVRMVGQVIAVFRDPETLSKGLLIDGGQDWVWKPAKPETQGTAPEGYYVEAPDCFDDPFDWRVMYKESGDEAFVFAKVNTEEDANHICALLNEYEKFNQQGDDQ